jgi:hypothetical protein
VRFGSAIVSAVHSPLRDEVGVDPCAEEGGILRATNRTAPLRQLGACWIGCLPIESFIQAASPVPLRCRIVLKPCQEITRLPSRVMGEYDRAAPRGRIKIRSQS